MAMPATVCVCSTHLASGRAPWIARMDDEARRVDDVVGVLDDVALEVDLDQVRRRHLAEMDPVGIDQEVFLAPGHPRRDMGREQVVHVEMGDEPVTGGEIDADVPFRLGHRGVVVDTLDHGACAHGLPPSGGWWGAGPRPRFFGPTLGPAPGPVNLPLRRAGRGWRPLLPCAGPPSGPSARPARRSDGPRGSPGSRPGFRACARTMPAPPYGA